MVRRAAGPTPAIAVGIAEYKGAPNDDGVVEVGYSVLRQFRRRGYASEAVAALIGRAFRDPPVSRVAAETYPHPAASIGVMLKNGLQFVGPGLQAGGIRYELTRAGHEGRALGG